MLLDVRRGESSRVLRAECPVDEVPLAIQTDEGPVSLPFVDEVPHFLLENAVRSIRGNAADISTIEFRYVMKNGFAYVLSANILYDNDQCLDRRLISNCFGL